MMQHSDVFGVSTDFISFDFGKMQDYKKRSVKRYRGEIEKLFEKNKIDYIKGTATIRRAASWKKYWMHEAALLLGYSPG